MSFPWQISVLEGEMPVYSAEVAGTVEVGRQIAAVEMINAHYSVRGCQRVVIAPKEEKSVSRQHAKIEPLDDGGFQVTNLSSERPISLADGTELKPRAACRVAAGSELTLGHRTLRLQRTASTQLPLVSLSERTLAPGKSIFPGSSKSLLSTAAASGDMKSMVQWLQAAMDVLQSAASSAEFFDRAAQALVDLVHLDTGRVLLLKGEEWKSQSLCTASRVAGLPARVASRHVLSTVRAEKKTFWEASAPVLTVAESLRDVNLVVAAPILDRNGAVIGALYGDRRQDTGPASPGPITEIEAMLVEVLARGVAAGLARLEQEEKALSARVQFEQFFTPELARQLALQPDLLKGRDAEVSILFCDIRSFSSISEHLAPAKTVEWLNDVMGTLSGCVLAHAGVLVDYIGDELIAMWGAPEEQPDHAQLACRAALDMLGRVPELNQRWQTVLKQPMEVGIGLNTGPARVGNTGSQYKFKYGPLGNTVNLASRIQGATKYLKCGALISGATRAKLGGTAATRRLCQVRVMNIAEPVDLHELVRSDEADWPQAKAEYEKALSEFENKNFSSAVRILGNWSEQHPADAPSLILLHRAVQCMVETPAEFDSVWVLPGK